MEDKAPKYLLLLGKMQQSKGEQRKLNCCQLCVDETVDKVTELTNTTTRTKQGCRSDCNN